MAVHEDDAAGLEHAAALGLRRDAGRLPDGAAIAAGALGGIERFVGFLQQAVDIVAHRIEAGNAEAGADRDGRVAAGNLQRADRQSQLLGRLVSAVLVGVRQQHGELFAAETAEQVGAAQLVADQLRHRRQHLVAGGMAIGVVDRLEVVEVEGDATEGAAVPAGEGDELARFVLEGAAARDPGQRVGRGETPQLQLVHGDMRQFGEDGLFARSEIADGGIDGADRADMETVAGGQRGTGIEAHMRVAGDIGVVAEALVERRIGHHDRGRVGQQVPAEGALQRHFIGREAIDRLVPLPVRIHQRDDADLDAQGEPDQPGDAIESLLAAAVEHVVAIERREPQVVRGGLERVFGENCLTHRKPVRR